MTVGNGPLDQPLVYEVCYNGNMMNVTSQNTQLPFTAPSLASDVFDDNITVTVTAINRFGRGEISDADSAVISRFHVQYMYLYALLTLAFDCLHTYSM